MTEEPVTWIDSHAHLTMFEPHEVAATIERAAEAGVVGILVPATGPADFERTLVLGREFGPQVAVAIGTHPHDADTLDAAAKRKIAGSLSEPGVMAVGEIGLDYHYMNSPREDQLRALEWQLDLALDADLPVVLHNRDSWVDLEPLLAVRGGSLRGVCHSFTEGPERVRRVLDLGLYVGISGMVTFRQAANIREMAAAVAIDRLLVETDSPFLAPVPHRGRRNEPSFVPLVGRAVAHELGLSVEEVATKTTLNVARLFAFDPTE